MVHNILVRAMVKWLDCCTKKAIGGLGLIDPKEVIKMLICKKIDDNTIIEGV